MTKTLLLIAILVALPVAAQEIPPPSPHLPLGDTLLTLPSAHVPWQGAWEIKFTHRFAQSIDEGGLSEQVHTLFGLDSSADVGFGGAYAFNPRLEASLIRSNTNDTLEAALKYVVLEQSVRMPLTMALRGGVDWRTEKELTDRTSVFAQAILSRRFGRRAEIFIMPTFATDAGRAVTGEQSGALFSQAFNVPVAAAVMIRPTLAVVAEVIAPNADLASGAEADAGWAIGLKRAIGAHWFEVLLTNSQATMVDQYVSSTFQGASLESGNVHLGFNIERRFGKRRK